MRLSLVRIFVVAGIAVASASVTSRAQEPRPIQDPDSYAVYASFVSTLSDYVFPGASVVVFPGTPFVVRREALTGFTCLPTGKSIDKDWKPVMDSYLKQNDGGRTILDGFDIGVPYVTAPAEKLRPLYDSRIIPDDPRPQHAVAPRPPPPPPGRGEVVAPSPTSKEPILGEGGLLSFSAVGFDRQKRRAVALLTYYSHKWGAHGGFQFFQQKSGHWKRMVLSDVHMCIPVA